MKLFFQDEGRFGRLSRPAACWAPEGVRPEVPAQLIREFTYVYSAACPQSGDCFSLILPWANTEAMDIFMGEFSKAYKDYRVVMVMDGAAWHTTNKLKKHENIRTLIQPPYSPEVNPVEHLWEHIRETGFRNQAFASMDDLENKLERILKDLDIDRETVQSITGFHWTVLDY